MAVNLQISDSNKILPPHFYSKDNPLKEKMEKSDLDGIFKLVFLTKNIFLCIETIDAGPDNNELGKRDSTLLLFKLHGYLATEPSPKEDSKDTLKISVISKMQAGSISMDFPPETNDDMDEDLRIRKNKIKECVRSVIYPQNSVPVPAPGSTTA